MDELFLKSADESLSKLIRKYHFIKRKSVNDNESYYIEYSSNSFGIKLEKYHREVYATLYRLDYPKKEINLFNLLNFLNQNRDSNYITSNYFDKEKDINKCYKMQLKNLSMIIYENFDLLNDFFNSENYLSNFENVEKFMINKYPAFFKKSD